MSKDTYIIIFIVYTFIVVTFTLIFQDCISRIQEEHNSVIRNSRLTYESEDADDTDTDDEMNVRYV